MYGASVRTVQRWLTALQNGGFIRIQDGAGGSEQRKIFAGINPIADTHDKNVMAPMTETSRPHDKNVADNMNNKKENKKEEQNPPISPKSKKGPMPAELIARVVQYAGEDAELQTRFLQFAENRKAIRKPIETNRTLTLLLSKLDKLSGGNRDKKLKLIDLATERNWLSFFPLRDDPPPRPAKAAAPTYEPEVSAWP